MPEADHHHLARAADLIAASIRAEPRTRHLVPAPAAQTGPGPCPPTCPVPDERAVAELLAIARTLIFPGFFTGADVSASGLDDYVRAATARLHAHARAQISLALAYICGERPLPAERPGEPPAPPTDADGFWAPWPLRLRRACALRGEAVGTPIDCGAVATGTARAFIEGLPEVRRLIALDVQAAFDGDPAAEHTDEIILCYPGIAAMFHHRLAHTLYTLGVPLLPRMIAETAHRLTGIDIHPGARIGERFFVDHGAGTVIGETTTIGNDVKVYQGVTLGARGFDTDSEGKIVRHTKRHPTVGSRVAIYAGAVILGGDTVIGDDCVINGGVFLTQGVPPGHIVRQRQAELTLRSNPALRGRGN